MLEKSLCTSEQSSVEALLARVDNPSLTVKAPDFGGSFEIGTGSDLLLRLLIPDGFERDLTDLVRAHMPSDRDAIDVGANVGLYTVLLAAGLVPKRQVLAVEPSAAARRLLERNLTSNSCSDDVIVFAGAASSERGQAALETVRGKEEYSSLGALVHPRVANADGQTEFVDCETLDFLVEHHNLDPGFLKIDAEGAEYLVLDGAQATIRRHQPVILMELVDALVSNTSGKSSAETLQLLSAMDYIAMDARSHATAVAPFSGEILAVPRRSAAARQLKQAE